MTTIITPGGVTTTSITAAPAADHAALSGVSWGAVIAGAAAAAALSLILLVLGAGLGFSAASPWTWSSGTSAALGGGAIAWIIFTSIAASAIGGYMAGRLRLRWSNVHADEVYFRDTAHGLLAWAIATLATAALLTSALTTLAGGVAQAGGAALKGAAATATAAGAAMAQGGAASAASGGGAPAMPYFVDTLFRSDAAPAADPNDAQSRAEAARIFAADIRAGNMGAADVRYLGQVVARKTGLAQADAEKRVADSFTQASNAIADAENKARQAADEARKAAAYASLWMFVALLAGAFCASFAALFGGRRRDDAYVA
jgi:hypothetical protein